MPHPERPVTVRVIRVASLPDGRRVARIDGPREVTFAFLEHIIPDDVAAELELVMQQGLDSGLYDQHLDDAEETPEDPEDPQGA